MILLMEPLRHCSANSGHVSSTTNGEATLSDAAEVLACAVEPVAPVLTDGRDSPSAHSLSSSEEREEWLRDDEDLDLHESAIGGALRF